MNKKVLIVAGVALAAAVVTTVFFGALLSDHLAAPAETPQVVAAVAVRDLPRGTRITQEDVELTKLDVTHAPAGVISSVEALEGRFLIQSATAGAPITQEFFPSRESGGMAAAIPTGMRAVSLHVEEYAGVTEIVEPGDRVDIYMATDRRSPGQKIDVKTILENIEVIDTGRGPDEFGRPGQLAVVTVIVDSGDARELSVADQSGAIRLALRNPTDGNITIQSGGPAQQAQAASVDPVQ